MKTITRPAVAILLLLISLTINTSAQQKRQVPVKPQPKPPAAPTPAPTFDTLVPADSYIVYGEARGAGQIIRSSAFNDLLEPILKLAGPPKEFRTIVKWLQAHAEEVMTSRLLLATWPNNKTANNVPEAIVAIEFASAEEATKFSAGLNEFLPSVLPPVPEPSPENARGSETTEKPKRTTPNFHLKRFGSLVVITPKPWTIKQLRPSGSKLLAEDTNFRAAHNRFYSEPLFVYVDTKVIKRQDEEAQKRWQQDRELAQKQAKTETETNKAVEPPQSELTEEEKAALLADEMARLQAAVPPGDAKEEPPPDPFSSALNELPFVFLSAGESEWPDGLAFALSFEGDSFDLRALLVNQGGEKPAGLPFVPILMTGPAVVPEAPNIFPADTELLVMMSLDLPQIYATISKTSINPQLVGNAKSVMPVAEVGEQSRFAEIEKRLKLSIKNDLLPLLGSEIALRLPIKDMGMLGVIGIRPGIIIGAPQESKEKQPSNGPALAIALRDKDAVRALMPKLIENLGFKGASAFAQSERREDTEIVSYANLFSYAFIGNFLVLSGDAATTRHIVDSYLKHETLSSDSHFRDSTRWQPRPQHGQIYISPVLMEGYKQWAEEPSMYVSDQTRAFLMRASAVAQPITYSLSNEGLGPLHEVHIPKSLVLMAVAGISGESNPPPAVRNERMAIGLLYTIAHAQGEYKKTKGNGTFGTLEQLIAADLVPKEIIEHSGYRFEVTVSGDRFEATAVPLEYGKGGHLSLFIDSSRTLRGGDRNGATATASDPPIN